MERSVGSCSVAYTTVILGVDDDVKAADEGGVTWAGVRMAVGGG